MKKFLFLMLSTLLFATSFAFAADNAYDRNDNEQAKPSQHKQLAMNDCDTCHHRHHRHHCYHCDQCKHHGHRHHHKHMHDHGHDHAHAQDQTQGKK